LEVAVDVALHEDRAALAEPERFFTRQRNAREVVFDAYAEFLRTLLQEAAGAGSTRLVHGEINDDSLFEADELRILAADFKDGVHAQTENGLVDEGCACLMGGDSSLTVSAPTSSPMSSRPEPVVPTPQIRIFPPSSCSISRRPG